MSDSFVQDLADCLVLGSLLEKLQQRCGRYELADHWKQGEFHHDVVLSVPEVASLPGRILVVATNCNAGIKEVLCFDAVPDRWALWHWRCPKVNDFSGDIPPSLARAVTPHWFDPCDLLTTDARSELLPEHRQRQAGGGWEMTSSACAGRKA